MGCRARQMGPARRGRHRGAAAVAARRRTQAGGGSGKVVAAPETRPPRPLPACLAAAAASPADGRTRVGTVPLSGHGGGTVPLSTWIVGQRTGGSGAVDVPHIPGVAPFLFSPPPPLLLLFSSGRRQVPHIYAHAWKGGVQYTLYSIRSRISCCNRYISRQPSTCVGVHKSCTAPPGVDCAPALMLQSAPPMWPPLLGLLGRAVGAG